MQVFIREDEKGRTMGVYESPGAARQFLDFGEKIRIHTVQSYLQCVVWYCDHLVLKINDYYCGEHKSIESTKKEQVQVTSF